MKGRLERTALTQSLQIILLSEPAVEKGRRTTGMQTDDTRPYLHRHMVPP